MPYIRQLADETLNDGIKGVWCQFRAQAEPNSVFDYMKAATAITIVATLGEIMLFRKELQAFSSILNTKRDRYLCLVCQNMLTLVEKGHIFSVRDFLNPVSEIIFRNRQLSCQEYVIYYTWENRAGSVQGSVKRVITR